MREIASTIETRLDEPTARGLANAVSRAIGAGDLAVGAKLPTVRYLASELALSPTTVSAAWSLLIRSGAIRTDGRRGTFVAEFASAGAIRYRRALHSIHGVRLDLASGVPDPDLLPDLSRAMATLRVAGSGLNYLVEPILPELDQAIRSTWPYDVATVMMADGALDALDLVTRTTLGFGDRVLVEDPTFPAAVDQIEATGADIVGVQIDDEGIMPQHLAKALERPARAVFLQPRGQNPTGASMTSARARKLANLLRGTGTLVIEDDSTGDLASAADVSLGQWIPEQTVHVRSYSKSHGPDLRLAAMSAPEGVMTELLGRRQLGQGWSSRLLQQILLSLLTDQASVREVETAREEYADRRTRLAAILATHKVRVSEGDGLNIWVPVRNETAAMLRLAAQGIGVAPGQPFTLSNSEPHIRVSLGQAKGDLDALGEAIADAALGESTMISR